MENKNDVNNLKKEFTKNEVNNSNEEKNNKNKLWIILTIIIVIIIGTIIVYARISKDNCTNSEPYFNPESPIAAKPIIYLYPNEETEITIRMGNPRNLTHTYPKYEKEWKVIAKPSGDLTDIKTGRNLYALYWEGINTITPNLEQGFIVKGEDSIEFLEEKLELLGLTERETEEFIIYWLPKLESNKYNFIRFQTEKEINENMPLEIIPNPDTIIRVMMEFKKLEKPITIQEQDLKPQTRNAFTVVEWGGTEIR